MSVIDAIARSLLEADRSTRARRADGQDIIGELGDRNLREQVAERRFFFPWFSVRAASVVFRL
jgi:hypothetical protein